MEKRLDATVVCVNMFIKELKIKNFRLFPSDSDFSIENVNVPDLQNEGSGLNLFVGENGCGKTTLLDAFALPLLQYKADSFSINDFNNPQDKCYLSILSEENFTVAKTVPRSYFEAKGFSFDGRVRSRENRIYLSSIVVTNQEFIPTNPESFKENSPDLRIKVDNPWAGPRFTENDIVVLDKNRINQTRSGVYNSTRFDRLLEDFDFQYIKNGNIDDLCETIKKSIQGVENEFLKKAMVKFEEISREKISLNYIDNWRPHSKAFLGTQKENKQLIPLSMLGSGYEMIFSLIYSFYLSQQSGKQLIILIDEPELHLHPKIQEDFVKILLEFSKTAQIILTTQSPLLVKQVMYNDKAKVSVIKKDVNRVYISPLDDRLLPYVSANEINFIAYDFATEEYHNELYEELQIRENNKRAAPLCLKDFDLHFFQKEKGEIADRPYNGSSNQVSIHTHLRTQIHHRGTSGRPDAAEIEASIKKMRTYF